jgi:hypothetical protein
MNNIKTFEDFNTDLNINTIAEQFLASGNLDAIVEELTSEDLNESEDLELNEGLFSIIMRKKRINAMIKKEPDFKKREKLKAELRGLSDKEVKFKGQLEKLKAAKKALKDQRAKAADDKAKFAIDKKMAKIQNKIEQVEGKEAKAQRKLFKKRSF